MSKRLLEIFCFALGVLPVSGVAWAEPPAGPTTETVDLLAPLPDQSEDWRTRRLFTGRDLTVYGQISQAFLGYSDGAVRQNYAPVDNSNASTRVGLLYDFRSLGAFTAIGRAEFGLAPRPSSKVNILDPSGGDFEFDGSNVRKFELIIDTPWIGTFTIGQGSMATDGIAEIDLSRTAVTAFSDVGSTAGGQFLRQADGTLTSLTIGQVFDNFDGDRVNGENSDGSRKLRLRYDTRERAGLKVSLAYGVPAGDNLGKKYGDIALRYSRGSENFVLSTGLGYSYKAGKEIASGSVSVLDQNSGLGLTLSAGRSSQGGRYGYGKVSFAGTIIPVGKTAFSLDYYLGSDLSVPGSQSRSIGVAAVQQLRLKNLEFYFLARRYSFDSPSADYLPGRTLFAGLRWAF